jgi:hypothetical protein
MREHLTARAPPLSSPRRAHRSRKSATEAAVPPSATLVGQLKHTLGTMSTSQAAAPATAAKKKKKGEKRAEKEAEKEPGEAVRGQRRAGEGSPGSRDVSPNGSVRVQHMRRLGTPLVVAMPCERNNHSGAAAAAAEEAEAVTTPVRLPLSPPLPCLVPGEGPIRRGGFALACRRMAYALA